MSGLPPLGTVSALAVASTSAVVIFGGFLVGWGMRTILPGHHFSKESQDTVKLGAGMVATMAALVLGLLVSSAKTAFDSVNVGLENDGARILILDRTLERYGPETKPARALLRQSVATAIARGWPEEASGGSNLRAFESVNPFDEVDQAVHQLVPANAAQQGLVPQIQQTINELLLTRALVIEQQQTTLPTLFLVLLVAWVALLFFTFGIFAPRNPTVATVMLICALCVSSSILLILEMDQPLDGIVQASPAPLRHALQLLGP